MPTFRHSQLLTRANELAAPIADDARPVVLLADANSTEAGILLPLIEKRNLRVVVAAEGVAALQLAIQESAQLVIAALDLPQVNGYELCQKLRDLVDPSIPFMLITPRGVVPDQQIGHETFASDYVQRPVDVAEFESRLASVLRSHHVGQGAPPVPGVTEPGAGPPGQGGHAPAPRSDAPPVRRTEEPRGSSAPPEPKLPESRIDELLEEFRKSPHTPSTPPQAPSAASTQASLFPSIAEPETRNRETLPESFDREKLHPRRLEQLGIADDTAGLYRQALVFVASSLVRAEMDEQVDFFRGLGIARRIVESLETNDSLLILATEKSSQYQLSEHCVNVAIVGTRIARTLELPTDLACRVCLAGLLHDIGTVKLRPGMVHKKTPFTPEERKEFETRPLLSARIVSGVGELEWLPEVVAQIYERDDGSGYPRGLRGKDICEEARILAAADAFEGYLHHRPHRRAGTGYHVLEILTSQGTKFTDRIIKGLLRSVTVYPHNEFVVLNTREIGRVVGIHPQSPLRPVVRVIYSSETGYLHTPKIIDLASTSSLWITRAITADDLPQEQ